MDKYNQKGKRPPLTKSDIDKFSIYTWVKDTKFRFMSCSENLSELAGEDSPSGMIGKDDSSTKGKCIGIAGSHLNLPFI